MYPILKTGTACLFLRDIHFKLYNHPKTKKTPITTVNLQSLIIPIVQSILVISIFQNVRTTDVLG